MFIWESDLSLSILRCILYTDMGTYTLYLYVYLIYIHPYKLLYSTDLTCVHYSIVYTIHSVPPLLLGDGVDGKCTGTLG